MDAEGWAFLVPISAILGGCAVAAISALAKARVREARIRERIAMIEKGLVPPPEADPGGFEQGMHRFDRVMDRVGRPDYRYFRSERHRGGGIMLIGIGFGLMLLIALAGESPREAVGVGGFLVVLGVAFLIKSLFERSSDQPRPETAPPPDAQESKPL